MVRQHIQEGAHKIEVESCDVGDLEDRANSPGHELRGSIDTLLSVFDENGDFASARRLQDFTQLSDGLLENLRRADIDFGDDNHDRDI